MLIRVDEGVDNHATRIVDASLDGRFVHGSCLRSGDPRRQSSFDGVGVEFVSWVLVYWFGAAGCVLLVPAAAKPESVAALVVTHINNLSA